MSYVEAIANSFDENAARAFRSLVHILGVGEDDERLAIAAAIAPLVTDLDATATSVHEAVEEARKLPGEVRKSVDDGIRKLNEDAEVTITGKVAAAIELMRQEIQSMARDCAVSEYSTASMLRSQAIADEVRALRAAAEQFVSAGGAPAPAGEVRRGHHVPVWFRYGGAFLAGVFACELFVRLMHH